MKIKPLNNVFITSRFGHRIHPVTAHPSFHNGIDLRAAIGTPCLAIADGRVVVSKVNNGGPSIGLGYYIIIEHDGFCTLYAHLDRLGLPVGRTVKAGDTIGFTGNSGTSTAPHLHFEIRIGKYNNTFFTTVNGRYPNAVDPTTFELPQKEEAWEKIVRETQNSPDGWIPIIKQLIAEGEKNRTITRFLPQFIENIAGRR